MALAAQGSALCDGASCNSLFAPNLPKGYVNTRTPIQPRVGIAYSFDEKTVIRAGGGRFVTAMGLLDNIFPGGNSPFQPFVTVTNVSVDNPGAALTSGTAAALTITTLNHNLKPPEAWNYTTSRLNGNCAQLSSFYRVCRSPWITWLAGIRYQPSSGWQRHSRNNKRKLRSSLQGFF